MRARTALTLLFLVVGTKNLAAQTGSSGEFLVTLRSGALFRGEVLEYEPGQQVTIRTVRGEVRTFPWRDVASAAPVNLKASNAPGQTAVSPKAEPLPPPAAAVVPPAPVKRPAASVPAKPLPSLPPPPSFDEPAPAPASSQNGSALTSLASEKGAIVQLALRSTEKQLTVQFLAGEMEVSGFAYGFGYGFGSLNTPVGFGGVPGTSFGVVDGVAQAWRKMCDYPCGVPVARKAIYRVVGDDMTPSEQFSLPKTGGAFTLHVHPGRPSTKIGGWVLLAIGGVVLGAGAGLLSAWADPDLKLGREYGIGGAAVLGLGAAMMFGSIPVFLKARTKVELEHGIQSTARRSVPAPLLPSSLPTEAQPD